MTLWTKNKQAQPVPNPPNWLMAPADERQAVLELLATSVDNCATDGDLTTLLEITGKLIRRPLPAWQLYARIIAPGVHKMVAITFGDNEPAVAWFYYQPDRTPADLTGPAIPTDVRPPTGYIQWDRWTIFQPNGKSGT